jgi:heptosyltransferase III
MKSAGHVLISRTDSIGDVVLTLPLAGYLKTKLPGTRITFIGRTYTEPIITLSRHVDRFLNLDIIGAGRFRDQVANLEKLRADWILHAYPSPRLSLAAWRAGILRRVGTSHRLHHLAFCNELVHFSRRRSDLHEAELNFKLLAPIGLGDTPALSTMHSYYGIDAVPSSPSVSGLFDPNRFNLILHPRSRGSAREWGLANYERLVGLLPESEYKIFVTGTRDEGISMKDFLKKIEGRIVDLTGRFSLSELIAFIAQADGLVACSTGPLHIAAALGKKAIGIYAPMRPIHPGRWAPLGKHAKALALEIECNSCRKSKSCSCMQQILPEDVIRALVNEQ